MILVLIIGKIILSWGHIDINPGDITYALFLIWPVAGFAVGYLSGLITDKILNKQVTC